MRPVSCVNDACDSSTKGTRSWTGNMGINAYQRTPALGAVQLEQFLAAVESDAYRLVLAACRDPDEAVDIVQDAMTQLVVKYRHNDAEQWPPLFHRILQNRIREWYRRRKVKNTLLRWTGLGSVTDQTDNIKADERHGPDAQLDSNDKLSCIHNAVTQLPLRQQQVFLLRAWQELSVNETAHAMNITAGSVKTHYSRALNTLRDLLKTEEENQ